VTPATSVVVGVIRAVVKAPAVYEIQSMASELGEDSAIKFCDDRSMRFAIK
jgi:hypothetical protein